jgi:iron complex outermembrane receptor protein
MGHRMRAVKYGATAFLPWALIASASAQVTDPARASDQENTNAEIVVTAQKRQERLQDVPISITALSGEALDRQPVGGVTDALRSVPGVSITSTPLGGATQITIRGVAANGDAFNGASTAAYYLDSVPFGLVKSAILPDTNAYDMERVEVLRGPQGTLYGANALNGVVRLLTHDADLSRFELKARAGFATTKDGSESYRGDLAVNVPLVEDRLALRVVGGSENAGGWVDQPIAGQKDVNEARSRYIRAKLNAEPVDGLDIGLSAWISRSDQDAPSYSFDDRTQAAPFALPQSLNFDAYNAKVAHDFSGFSIESATSYLKFFNNSKRDYTALIPGLTLDTIFRSKVFTEEVLLRSNNKSNWRWSVGAFYRDAKDVLHQELGALLPAPINFGDNSESYAIFGEVTHAMLDGRLEVTGGLRYFKDRVSQIELTPLSGSPNDVLINTTRTFDAVTPRVVLTYLPSRDLTLYASYSQGFRSGFNQEPPVIREIPSIPPAGADRLTNYEIGGKGKLLDGKLSFEGALFYIDWKDIQQNANVVINGIVSAATINGANASGLGADLALTLHPARGLDIGGTFSWNDLKLTSPTITQTAAGPVTLFPKGSRPAFSPEYNATAFASYAFPVGSGGLTAQLSGGLVYSSEMIGRVLSAGTVAYFESDDQFTARAKVSLMSPQNWTLSLYGENLTDFNGITMPPTDPARQFRLRPRTIGLQFEFNL